MMQFTVYHNDEPIKTYEFSNPIITIGRLPENDIPIASISISRRHVRIEQDAAHQYVLNDLNSLNGTFINNKKITKTNLADGDKITIGKYAIVVNITQEAEEASNVAVFEKRNDEIITDSDEIPVTNEEDDDISEELSSKEDLSTAIMIETNKHVIYKIDKDLMSIGSSEKDDIFVEGFLITDGHVLIEKENDNTWIHANKLMGRFKVNGKKVSKHLLQHKDRIEIGTSTFRYMENGQRK